MKNGQSWRCAFGQRRFDLIVINWAGEGEELTSLFALLCGSYVNFLQVQGR
jgi:hypothetical protein